MVRLLSIRLMFVLALLVFMSAGGWAQWPEDPALNMIISDQVGAQVISKVAATSDGGCYVSWYSNASGNYDLYLQKLNGDGEIQWVDNGLLISNHPQETWLTDYDMTVDGEDHAIIVFNDIRNGGDWDIYAYRISPDGDFVWGADGLTISDNDGFEPDPRVTITSNGNVVIAWKEDDMVHLRKLTLAGDDFWDPSTITLTSTYGLSAPRVVPAENDGIILQLMVASGPNWWDPQHIYAHKFDSDGVEQWGTNGVAVMTTGGIAAYMKPDIVTDENGGAYSFWYDTRNLEHHVYVQHILTDGSMDWTTNGVRVSLASAQLQMDPSLVFEPETGDILVFYKATDLSQTIFGVYGQKLNTNGERQWGDGGVVLALMNSQDHWDIYGSKQDDGAIVTYFEYLPGSAVNSLVKAIGINDDGVIIWDPSPVEMSTVISEKMHMAIAVNINNQVIATWTDSRIDDSGDVYLQNINPDGTLGPLFSPGCDYVPGDANGDGNVMGNDVTYSVRYFKGLGNPPPDSCPYNGGWLYSAGDANGNCSYAGSDVTFLVGFFKGINQTILWCPDTPPAGLVVLGENKDGMPAVLPGK